MSVITVNHYFILAAILFGIGLYGVMRRKNLLMLFFATEILLNAANIALAAVSSYYKDPTGQIFALFIIAIAASEVAVGLGFLILMFKRQGSIDLDKLQIMKG
jgi:NADH-quinone oxidoreductase subunit K